MLGKKRKMILSGVVVVVVIVCGITLWWWLNEQGETPPGTYMVEYTLKETSTGWYINITNTIAKDGGIIEGYKFKAEFGGYLLIGPLNSTSGHLADINGTPSSDYNITWNDIDSDGMLSIGDNFFISKTGGTDGVAKTGDIFWIDYSGCNLAKVIL